MPVDSLRHHWATLLHDRARTHAFMRFALKRFWDDRLFEVAGALAYTTLFALVPLSMVAFGVLSAFPVFQQWSDQLSDYIFSNFVPSAARAVESYLREFSSNTSQLTTAGVIALVVSLLITLASVEAAFNRIWRVPTARPQVSRFLVYWTVLTLGTMVAAASLAISTRFFALSLFQTSTGRWLESALLWIAPMIIELLCFAAIFRVVPHRTVKWRHALVGALLSVASFELVKWAIGLYLGSFGTYQKIYGPVAAVPILMLWVYMGWATVLLGASFAASLSAFRYQPAAMRLPQGYEMYGLLRLLGRLHQARRTGKGLHSDEMQTLEPMLTDDALQTFLGQLADMQVVARAESGEWLLARDLEQVSLADLYEACHLRIPIAEARLPCRDDALGQSVSHALDDLRLPLRDMLRPRVASLYAQEDASP